MYAVPFFVWAAHKNFVVLVLLDQTHPTFIPVAIFLRSYSSENIVAFFLDTLYFLLDFILLGILVQSKTYSPSSCPSGLLSHAPYSASTQPWGGSLWWNNHPKNITLDFYNIQSENTFSKFSKFWLKCLKCLSMGVPTQFSPENKCVSNDSE